MSAQRDVTRIVRSWLRTDENESADRVLGSRAGPARHDPTASSHLVAGAEDINHEQDVGIGLGAAAVVVVALVGPSSSVADRGGTGGWDDFTPEPSVAEPTATPEPSPSAAAETSTKARTSSLPREGSPSLSRPLAGTARRQNPRQEREQRAAGWSVPDRAMDRLRLLCSGGPMPVAVDLARRPGHHPRGDRGRSRQPGVARCLGAGGRHRGRASREVDHAART